jgi:hypothetical protein
VHGAAILQVYTTQMLVVGFAWTWINVAGCFSLTKDGLTKDGLTKDGLTKEGLINEA